MSCSDDQEVTLTLTLATSTITVSTADFTSSIAGLDGAACVRPAIWISPGNSAQLLRVRVRSCE